MNLLPSGTIDVMPTFLHLLGYPIPPQVDGRVLYEALAQSHGMPELETTSLAYSTEATTSAGVYRQHVETSQVGRTVYVERGWIE